MRVEGLKMLSAKPDSANIFQLRAPTRMFACDCSTMLHRLREVWAWVYFGHFRVRQLAADTNKLENFGRKRSPKGRSM